MPILSKKTENRLPISTDVLINGIALTIIRCTFVDIYDETNNSVEAVIHNIMYDVINYCAKNTC